MRREHAKISSVLPRPNKKTRGLTKTAGAQYFACRWHAEIGGDVSNSRVQTLGTSSISAKVWRNPSTSRILRPNISCLRHAFLCRRSWRIPRLREAVEVLGGRASASVQRPFSRAQSEMGTAILSCSNGSVSKGKPQNGWFYYWLPFITNQNRVH